MVKNFEDMFIRFDRIHERDRQAQTDRHRMTKIGSACVAPRGKNAENILYVHTVNHQFIRVASDAGRARNAPSVGSE